MIDSLESLTSINLDDLVGALGWERHPRLVALTRLVFRAPAQAFARQMLEFDANVSKCGLVEAARITERLHARDVRVWGAENIPDGPVLIVSNHPGMTDTLALFAALRRHDLRAIALNRPFLLSLHNLRRHLLFLEPETGARVAAIRAAANHLRRGGAVLTFPAGRNELDPHIQSGAVASLKTWADSASVFVRLVPGTLVLPVCVRGVLWKRAADNPLTRLRGLPDDQQLLASAIQLMCQTILKVRPVTVSIQIGRPIESAAEKRGGQRSLHATVLAEMRCLLQNPPGEKGVSAL